MTQAVRVRPAGVLAVAGLALFGVVHLAVYTAMRRAFGLEVDVELVEPPDLDAADPDDRTWADFHRATRGGAC